MNDHFNETMRGALAGMTWREDKDALLRNLCGAREALWAEKSDIDARMHDVNEQIARLQGEASWAEWHRLAAEAERNPSPEAKQVAHRAWVVAMAEQHLRLGTVPDSDAFHADEIEAEIDALAALKDSSLDAA